MKKNNFTQSVVAELNANLSLIFKSNSFKISSYRNIFSRMVYNLALCRKNIIYKPSFYII